MQYSEVANRIPYFEAVFPSPHFEVSPRFLDARASSTLGAYQSYHNVKMPYFGLSGYGVRACGGIYQSTGSFCELSIS